MLVCFFQMIDDEKDPISDTELPDEEAKALKINQTITLTRVQPEDIPVGGTTTNKSFPQIVYRIKHIELKTPQDENPFYDVEVVQA